MALDHDKLQRFSEDDAFAFAVEALQQLVTRQSTQLKGSGSFEIGTKGIAALWLGKEGITDNNDTITAYSYVSRKFYSAMWALCLRGVLMPSVSSLNISGSPAFIPGNDFSITQRGQEWLKDTNRPLILVSSNNLLTLLQKYESRLGPGYLERATEAVKCLDSGCFLACCAMCGAAAEAILLHLAIAKKGDEDEVLKQYNAASGRKYVRNLLQHNKPAGLVTEVESGFTLLTYWRDNAAHGAATTVTDVNARTALSLLLGLAETADTRWTELTT